MAASLFPDPTPPGTPAPRPKAGGKSLLLQFDGGSRGNPGPAGIGVTLTDEKGTPVYELSEFLGVCTNNIAEYTALVRGLTAAKALGATKVAVRSDSELLVRQINGIYRVKHPGIKPLYEQATALMRQIGDVKVTHTYREGNARADELANLAMDMQAKSEPLGAPGSTPSKTVREDKVKASNDKTQEPAQPQEFAATFRDGVFDPDQRPALPEGARVRLQVILLEERK